MSGDHPAKILDGTKTMTRRTYGLEEINKNPDDWRLTTTLAPDVFAFYHFDERGYPVGDIERIKCPYGQVGDRLWVRETHYCHGFWSKEPKVFNRRQSYTFVPMDEEKFPVRYLSYPPDIVYRAIDRYALGYFKRSSIFMFKKDARTTLEITEVRVERVQEITAKDAIAEGIGSRNEEWIYQESNGSRHLMDFTTPTYKRYDRRGVDETRCPQLSFLTLWDSLNAKRGYSWEINPWVWPIGFKVVT